MCKLSFPDVKLTLPGQAASTPKIPKDMCPGIPILKNTQPVLAHTRLVALHDPVVAVATEREIAKRKADRQAAEEAADKAREAKAAKKG